MNVRLKTGLVLAGTLVVGALIGSLLTGAANDSRMQRLSRLRAPGGFAAHMEQVVAPRDSVQRLQVRAVLDRYDHRLDSLFHDYRARRNATLDAMQAELRPLLDATQRERLDDWQREGRRRHSHSRDKK